MTPVLTSTIQIAGTLEEIGRLITLHLTSMTQLDFGWNRVPITILVKGANTLTKWNGSTKMTSYLRT